MYLIYLREFEVRLPCSRSVGGSSVDGHADERGVQPLRALPVRQLGHRRDAGDPRHELCARRDIVARGGLRSAGAEVGVSAATVAHYQPLSQPG